MFQIETQPLFSLTCLAILVGGLTSRKKLGGWVCDGGGWGCTQVHHQRHFLPIFLLFLFPFLHSTALFHSLQFWSPILLSKIGIPTCAFLPAELRSTDLNRSNYTTSTPTLSAEHSGSKTCSPNSKIRRTFPEDYP